MTDLADQLLLLQEESPVLLASFDEGDRLRYANRSFREAFGLAINDFSPAPPRVDFLRACEAINPGTVLEGEDLLRWIDGPESRPALDEPRTIEVKLKDGRWLLVQESLSADGWLLVIGSDITRLRADVRAVRRDRDEALRAAHTDDLTGVANRRFVITQIEDMLAHPDLGEEGGEGTAAAGSLCVLDLDNFKYINDRYGHQAGDAILRDFAGRVGGQVRRSDCFGRVGGEEFVLVLPGTAMATAVTIVERMLAMVRASRPLAELPDFTYTFSCGVAGVRPGDDFTSLYGRADKALYAAKLAGRNRVLLEETEPGVVGI